MTKTRSSNAIYNVGFTAEELAELILLIDDKPVDEEFLQGIRRKLAHKKKTLNRRVRNGKFSGSSFQPPDFSKEN